MEACSILLVDDDREDRMIIQEAMETQNSDFIFLAAESGQQALDMLYKDFTVHPLPCLIVLDLNIPKMNGTQTLTKLKNDERFKTIPVIIYSTSINRLEKEKCLLLGAHSYITKPISLKETEETATIFLGFCPKS